MQDPPRSAARSLMRVLLSAVPLADPGLAGGRFGWPWHQGATAGDSLRDETGIDVNLQMPGPLRRWACACVAEHFRRTLPSGCERPWNSGTVPLHPLKGSYP